jgi:hypothetical protein
MLCIFAPKIADGGGNGAAKYKSDLPTVIRVVQRKANPVGMYTVLYKPAHS